MRGSGDWHFLLRFGKQDIDRQSLRLKASDEWRRISLVFDPESTGGLYALGIQGVGQLWIDYRHKSPTVDGFAGDGSLHPSAAAHANLAWHLEDTSFVRRAEVADGVFAYVFQGADRAVAVLSSSPNPGQYTIPHVEGVSVRDLFGNPLAPNSRFSGTLVFLSTPDGLPAIDKLWTATNG